MRWDRNTSVDSSPYLHMVRSYYSNSKQKTKLISGFITARFLGSLPCTLKWRALSLAKPCSLVTLSLCVYPFVYTNPMYCIDSQLTMYPYSTLFFCRTLQSMVPCMSAVSKSCWSRGKSEKQGHSAEKSATCIDSHCFIFEVTSLLKMLFHLFLLIHIRVLFDALQ